MPEKQQAKQPVLRRMDQAVVAVLVLCAWWEWVCIGSCRVAIAAS